MWFLKWDFSLISKITTYSKILLMRLAGYQTGAILSNIVDYRTVPSVTKVLTIHCLLLFLFWALSVIGALFHSEISFVCCLRVIRVLFCVLWSSHIWRIWWSRRQGVRNYHRHSWRLFLTFTWNMPVSSMDFFFLVKTQNFWSWVTHLKCQIIGINEMSD